MLYEIRDMNQKIATIPGDHVQNGKKLLIWDSSSICFNLSNSTRCCLRLGRLGGGGGRRRRRLYLSLKPFPY